MDAKQAVVYIHRNGNNCLYVVNDLCILDNIVSFHIEETFYKFKFSFVMYKSIFGGEVYDCTKLQALN